MKNNKGIRARFNALSQAIKGFCTKKITPIAKKLYNKKFLFILVSAVFVNLVIEILGRMDFINAVKYVFTSFHMFVFSTAVIMATLSIALFFKRRLCVHYFIACVWIGFGLVNMKVLSYRSTPLVAIDFMLMRFNIDVLKVYISSFLLVLIVLALGAAIALLVLIYKKVQKEKVAYKSSVFTLGGTTLFALALVVIFNLTHAVPTSLRLPEIYDKCGYIYCLTYSLVDYGVDEPETYNEEYMNNIKDVIDEVEEACPEDKPNIVFLQLESFMDMNRIKGLEMSENPHPYFSQLKEDYPSGSLQVNALGACTANVEFEVLTGTYIKDYGFDEYPYKTFLKEQSVETVAYNLKSLGYATTSMHNHDGNFYSRHIAYSNLGFDRYIPRECMLNVQYTPVGWAKDEILTEYIQQTINSTDEKDFVFAVSVQGHSKYPKELLEDYEYDIKLSGFDDEEYMNMLTYYAQMMREEDEFIKGLIETLSNHDEKVILVMYGDHLPTFIRNSDQLVDGFGSTEDTDKYNSEYVVWSNFEISAEDADLTACELASTVLDYVGIRVGNVMRLYHADIEEEQLKNYRLAITYDNLEGHHYLNGGENPYSTTDLVIGAHEVKINEYDLREDTLYIAGEGFTEDTRIFVNGKKYATGYISSNLLRITEQVKLKNDDEICAKIISGNTEVFSESNKYVISGLEGDVVANKGKLGIRQILSISALVGFVVITVTAVVVKVVISKRKKKMASCS